MTTKTEYVKLISENSSVVWINDPHLGISASRHLPHENIDDIQAANILGNDGWTLIAILQITTNTNHMWFERESPKEITVEMHPPEPMPSPYPPSSIER